MKDAPVNFIYVFTVVLFLHRALKRWTNQTTVSQYRVTLW